MVKPAKGNLAMATKKTPSEPLKLGDRVKIRYYPDLRARIVGRCGPLGPGGMQIYRIRIQRKPKPSFIEVREDQLEVIPAEN